MMPLSHLKTALSVLEEKAVRFKRRATILVIERIKLADPTPRKAHENERSESLRQPRHNVRIARL